MSALPAPPEPPQPPAPGRFARFWIRLLAAVLDALILGVPLLLGYLWMLWEPDRQCWHDKVVRDLVVEA